MHNTYVKEIFAKKGRDIDELKASVPTLEARVTKLEKQIDENSANERKNTLIMAGILPPAEQGEDCKYIVLEQTRECLRLELAIEDNSIAHRIGVKPKTRGEDKRNIMFKLCNKEAQQDILKIYKNMKSKKFYTKESLTPL